MLPARSRDLGEVWASWMPNTGCMRVTGSHPPSDGRPGTPIVHPLPSALNTALVIAIATVAGASLTEAGLLGLAMLGFQASIGALNDVVDADRDRLAKPMKPIPAGSDRQARSDHRRGGRRGDGSRRLRRLRPPGAHPGCSRLWLRAGVRPRPAAAGPGLALLRRRVPAAAGVDLGGRGWVPAAWMADPAAAGGPRGPHHPPRQQPRRPGRRRPDRSDQHGHPARRGSCSRRAGDRHHRHLRPWPGSS